MSIATTFLCVFFPTTPSIAYAQTIFLSVIIASHYFVFFVYFLNIYKLIQVTSSEKPFQVTTMQANKRRLDVAAGSDDKGNFTFY